MKWNLFIVTLTWIAGVHLSLADVTIANFEVAGQVQTSLNVSARRIETDSPQGMAHLRLSMKSDGLAPGVVQLPLDREISFQGADHLTAHVRVRGTGDRKVLRWVAFDERGKPIFQRRFELKPGESWIRLEEPLRQWRWHDATPGSWSEVRQLGLRIETPAAEVELDDIRLVGAATTSQRTDWLLHLAYQDRPFERLDDSSMLVATDAVDAFAEADLRSLVNDMLRVRTWTKRIFGDAVRPVQGEGPVMLLIFAANSDRKAFLGRLGEQWRATLPLSDAAGFTVQDLCTSTYDPAQGPRRPVYLHESVHGVLAHDLRLPSGYITTSSLQEGIANYIQLCVYPQSLSARTFAINFTRPIDPSGGGFFKPLKRLFETRATAETYAQLASVVAYLVERDSALLQSFAKGLADGKSAAEVLSTYQTDWTTFEKAWLDWGRARFTTNPPENRRFFDLPQEFQ